MKFDVFGKVIKVVEKKEEGNCGSFCPKTGIINIDPELTKKEKDITLCHELFHAMCYRLGFHNTNISHDVEELLADNFAILLSENADIKWKNRK